MLGMFSLLSFVRGWQYRNWKLEGIVQRGGRPIETTVSTNGWLNSVIFATSDCFGTVVLTPMHVSQSPSVNIFPEYPRQLGMVLPSAVGWLARYFRPDDVRTFGSFTVLIGPEASALPFVNPSKVQLSLGDLSTESSAYCNVIATGVELTDQSQFLSDLAGLPMFKNAELTKILSQLKKVESK